MNKPNSMFALGLASCRVVALLVIIVTTCSAAQAQVLQEPIGNPSTWMRQFYLSATGVAADQATDACADGYHFASLWELHDPSRLKYNTTLGQTVDDSGNGPPAFNAGGWVRTGKAASTANTAGVGNCNGWTSALVADAGTTLSLAGTDWATAFEWDARTSLCNGTPAAWCVQD